MYKYCLNFNENVTWLINQRSAGHNVYSLIKNKLPENTNLVIILDSSSNDTKTTEYLKNKDIDCLILDHHHIEKENRYAIVVNPQQENCEYQNKQSCAGLLTYKVCELMDEYLKADYSKVFKSLAGFSLAADAMNMKNLENRYYYGEALKNLNHNGIETLFRTFKKDVKKLSGEDFAFQVSPCITSATRLDQIELAIELLMTTENNPNLTDLCNKLIELNEERKQLQHSILQRIIPKIDNDLNFILITDDISSGIRGLIAQDVSKLYNKPAFVLSFYDKNIKGSFRSPDHIPFLEILNTCEDLKQCGGHMHAGGIDIHVDNLESFVLDLNKKLNNYKSEKFIEFNWELNKKDITDSLIKEINDFYRVTGNNFETGNFLIKNLKISEIKTLGSKGDTLKITTNEDLVLMKFKTTQEIIEQFKVGQIIDVIGTVNLNSWFNPRFQKNIVTKQIFINDFDIVQQPEDTKFEHESW